MLIKLYDSTVHDTKDGLQCSTVIYFEEVLRNLDLMYLWGGGEESGWRGITFYTFLHLGLGWPWPQQLCSQKST
jgi:hypothetical protein